MKECTRRLCLNNIHQSTSFIVILPILNPSL